MLKSRFLWQVWGVLGLTLIISTLVFGIFVAAQVERDALQRTEQTLLQQARALEPVLLKVLHAERVMSLEETVDLMPGLLARVTVIDLDGKVLADNRRPASEMDNHAARPEVVSSVAGYGTAERFSETLRQRMLYLAVQVQDGEVPAGYIRLALPLTTIEEQRQALNWRIAISAVTAGLLLLIVGYVLAYRITRPVAQMTVTAREIARGAYHLRLPEVDRRDEIGELSSVLNELATGTQARIDEITLNRNQLASVLAGLAEGVIALDMQRRILHINDAALAMLNMRGASLIGAPFEKVRAGGDMKQMVDAAVTESASLTSTLRIDQQVLECSSVLMKDSEGSAPTGIILVLEDVTERLQLEKVRSDFVANASHELKTPISAIRGLIETIIDDDEMPRETFANFIERIRRQSIRLDRIVQELLQLSRFDSATGIPRLTQLELGDLMKQVHESRLPDAEEAGIAFGIELNEAPLEIKGDREAIHQLITNLVDNAIKYTGRDGKVVMRLKRSGSLARIEVSDNGIGIAQDEVNRIFERFYRVDRARSRDLGGTGLGLAIVKHIAQAHRGSVSVESQLEVGSTFRVDIPLSAD